MVEAKAPIFMVNGYYLMGLVRDYNIDGTDLKNTLEDYYVVIRDDTGAVVGCTTDKLTSSASAPPAQDEGQSSLLERFVVTFPYSTSVFLITGGQNIEAYHDSVEVYVPSTGFSCKLEGSLPYVYLYGHVQSGLEVCGGESYGGGSLTQCHVWEGGQWRSSHQLSQARMESQVWDSRSGPVILAGSQADTWAERLAGADTVIADYLQLEYRLE